MTHALSTHVAKLERQHREALDLAGEVVATLRLNARKIAPADDAEAEFFLALVERWRRRLEHLEREAGR